MEHMLLSRIYKLKPKDGNLRQAFTRMVRRRQAARLSLVPGLGQIYNGEIAKGMLFVTVFLINGFLLLILAFPAVGARIVSGIADLTHHKPNWQALQHLAFMGPALLVYSVCVSSFIIYSIKDAWSKASSSEFEYASEDDPNEFFLSATVSGSFLFHFAVIALVFVVVLFYSTPSRRAKIITDVNYIEFLPILDHQAKHEKPKAIPLAMPVPAQDVNLKKKPVKDKTTAAKLHIDRTPPAKTAKTTKEVLDKAKAIDAPLMIGQSRAKKETAQSRELAPEKTKRPIEVVSPRQTQSTNDKMASKDEKPSLMAEKTSKGGDLLVTQVRASPAFAAKNVPVPADHANKVLVVRNAQDAPARGSDNKLALASGQNTNSPRLTDKDQSEHHNKTDLGPYIRKLEKRIGKHWSNPDAIQFGHVVVRFKISGDGAISHLKVDKTSGVDAADRLALGTIEKCAPFPPLPKGAASEIEVKFTISDKGVQ